MTEAYETLWNVERPVSEFTDVPAWVDSDIAASTLAAICQGGCDSGAYMPAVTYHDALATMSEHGDDVFGFIEERLGELPMVRVGDSWSGLACRYLSLAVELWASEAAEVINLLRLYALSPEFRSGMDQEGV